MIDKRPLLIARCVDVADVITAVNFARDNGLVLAIRGRAQRAIGTCDDGLVIDLSQMKGVRVEVEARTVRVGPGCTSGRRSPTHAFGLAVPFGIVSSTGVGGLTRRAASAGKHGLTIDNLLAADVVLADGGFITASKDQGPDLFWALRGGGGFGVVTSFLFAAHPVKMVYAGPIFWDAKDAVQIMRAYREFLPKAPEELGPFVGLKTVPSMDPFPREVGASGLRGDLLLQRLGRGLARRRWRRSSASCRRSSTGWARCRFPHAEPVRRLLPQGNAVVLEG